eukprot:gene6432-6662_t
MAHYGLDLLSTSNDLLTSLDRSAVALNMIAHTLENEFAERFGHTGANPLEVAKRLRRLQRDLPALKQECQALLSAKQELIDSAQRVLDNNSSQLQQLSSKAGFSLPDDQGVHDAYSTAVQEWEEQLLHRRLDAAVRPHAPQPVSRKLLQWGRWSQTNRNANTVRAQAATSQAILQAVESGGSLGATFNAGRVGSATSWAAAQPSQRTFDFVERFASGH